MSTANRYLVLAHIVSEWPELGEALQTTNHHNRLSIKSSKTEGDISIYDEHIQYCDFKCSVADTEYVNKLKVIVTYCVRPDNQHRCKECPRY